MRAIPLLIDDGYSTGGGGTDIAVIYDPNTGRLILVIVPPELVPFLECFTDCLISNYGLIAMEIILILIATRDYCLEVCTLCVGAPSFLNPVCLGCAGCIALWVGAVAGGDYATYRCVSQCKGQ